MLISQRKISKELAYYRALGWRSRLSTEEAKKLSALERGYNGECIYDAVFDEIGHGSVFVFRDIYLGLEDSVAQYDALIVSDAGITVNEIKNYSGFYRVEKGKWFAGNFEVPDDPVVQLNRAMNKLLKLQYIHRLNFEIEGKVVFPHIDFRLNFDDRDVREKLVMRPELRDYLKQFKNDYAGGYAERIVDAVSAHIIDNPFFDKSADFDSVRKGLYCGNCGSFEVEASAYHFDCTSCVSRETKESHVIRAISDYTVLFMNEKLTRKRFLEFIDYRLSPRTVVRMLGKYCSRYGGSTASYYEFNYESYEDVVKDKSYIRRYKNHMTNI